MTSPFLKADVGGAAFDDIQDWRITFVDTGLHANIAERLIKVRGYLDGEASFSPLHGRGCPTYHRPNDCRLSIKAAVASLLE